MNLPKTVTATYYAHISNSGYDNEVCIWSSDMSAHGYINLGPVEITFDVPQVDVVAEQIGSLEKAKAKVVQEYETKLHQIDEKIQNLRALSAPV